MKTARFALVGIALLAAGGAAILAGKLASRPEQVRIVKEDVEVPKIDYVEVLVADKDISLGTKIDTTMMSWRKWPRENLASGYLYRDVGAQDEQMEQVKGSIVRSAFFAGEPIRDSKLIRSTSGYMSAMLPAGQRAIATTISTDTSAGGFILPNDRVDVIMTRRKTTSEGEKFITETILENIRVLAIDQTIEEKDGESVVVGSTATLQLSPKQTEVLTVAQQMAERLALSLRSLQDNKEESTKVAEHLLSGNNGAARVRTIRYGKLKEAEAGN